MDEPLGALDAQTKQVVREELLRIWQHHQKMVVYVTHDIEEAVLLGDRVLVMTGRPARIRADIPIPLARPRHAARHATEIGEIRTQIWNMLEEEVRKSLCLGSATAENGA
jgi:NitT/TauT family transport system ATP-binding protein